MDTDLRGTKSGVHTKSGFDPLQNPWQTLQKPRLLPFEKQDPTLSNPRFGSDRKAQIRTRNTCCRVYLYDNGRLGNLSLLLQGVPVRQRAPGEPLPRWLHHQDPAQLLQISPGNNIIVPYYI